MFEEATHVCMKWTSEYHLMSAYQLIPLRET